VEDLVSKIGLVGRYRAAAWLPGTAGWCGERAGRRLQWAGDPQGAIIMRASMGLAGARAHASDTQTRILYYMMLSVNSRVNSEIAFPR
jgi:hypothetical protein